MPGRPAVARFVAAHFLTEPGGLRLVPVAANGERAFAVYQRQPAGTYRAHALLAVTVNGTDVSRYGVYNATADWDLDFDLGP